MRIGITGGRTYNDTARVDEILTQATAGYIKTRVVFIVGGARGADTLAEEWARKHGFHVARVDALWHEYREMAGPLRNSAMEMLKPEILIAFPGGNGTADMIRKCKESGIEVLEVK